MVKVGVVNRFSFFFQDKINLRLDLITRNRIDWFQEKKFRFLFPANQSYHFQLLRMPRVDEVLFKALLSLGHEVQSLVWSKFNVHPEFSYVGLNYDSTPDVKVGPVTPSKVKVKDCSIRPPISMLGRVDSEMKPVPVKIPPDAPAVGRVTVRVSVSLLGVQGESLGLKTAVT